MMKTFPRSSSFHTAAALALALLSAALPLAARQQAQPLDRIAAVVNDDVILQSELDRAVNNVRSQYAGNPQQLPPAEVLRRQVLERLVLMRLQVSRASDNGIRISDEELNNAIGMVARQNNLDLNGLRQRLASDGIGFEDFRTSIREEIIVQRLRQSFAQSRIQVSEAEVDAALTAQAGDNLQYHLAHILVGLPDGATAEQINTGAQKIEGIKELIAKGEIDFQAAAVRYSDSPNALEGGDLGWRSRDEIPVAFVNLLKDMNPGDVIGPIRGGSGFQLLKLVETRSADEGPGQQLTEYNVRHILVRITEVQDAARAKAKIDTLRARIEGGAEFTEVAKESSEDVNSRSSGGDLGWFPVDAYGPDFGQQITALQDGQVGQPFRTDAGWHIVQRVDSRQTDVTDLNKRAQVRETIGRRKLEDEYDRFLQELRGDAYVNVRDGSGT